MWWIFKGWINAQFNKTVAKWHRFLFSRLPLTGLASSIFLIPLAYPAVRSHRVLRFSLFWCFFPPNTFCYSYSYKYLFKNVYTLRAEVVFYSFLSIRQPYTVLFTKRHLVTIERTNQLVKVDLALRSLQKAFPDIFSFNSTGCWGDRWLSHSPPFTEKEAKG